MQKDVQRGRTCAFIFSASMKQHKNWSVLLCRSNATAVLLSHLHTLRIHQPLQRITDTNMHPTKCKGGPNCFATTAEMYETSSSVFYDSLCVRNRNTRNHTTEKRTAVSVWPHRRPPTGMIVNQVRDDVQ